MQNSHKVSLFTFISWFREKYIKLEKETLPHPCKLVGIVTKNYNEFAQVHFSGQAHVLEIDPDKIIELNLFEYFSSNDKKLLFSLVYNKEKFKLSDKYICRKSGREMVVLTDIFTGNKKTLPADVVSANEEIINKLNSKDANKIGFLSGMTYLKNVFKNLKAPE